MNQQPVIVIGAGPAGLSAGNELVGLGFTPIILEKSDKLGGIARTENYRDYYFDVGGHRFFTKVEVISRIWRDLMAGDFIKVPRMSRIFYRGRFFKYPLCIRNTLRNLGIAESIVIGASYLKAQLWPYPKEESFEHWVSNRFGKRLYETFFKTYTEKVWGIPCSSIRADWAAQRIRGLSLVSAVANALFNAGKAKSLINEFDYPPLGPGMMWQRFRESIDGRGGEVRLGAEAVKLKQANGRVVSLTCREAGNDRELPVGHLISSLPLSRLVELLEPKAPEPVLAAAANLSYRAFLIVVLIIDKRHLFPDQWIYVHSPDVQVGRIQNFKNWSSAMVPDPCMTSIGMEYFCDQGDDFWILEDRELVAIASRELEMLGLAQSADIRDGLVVRQPYAYPVYDRDYKRHLEVIKDYLGELENVTTIGRNGMHRYNNMDHSMLTGLLAARNLAGEKHNLWEINEEGEYLEEDQAKAEAARATEEILVRTFARMEKLSFGIAAGMVSGMVFFLATLWLVIKGGRPVGPHLRLLSNYFYGYTVTAPGSFIAFGYGFLWAFLLGWLFAYLRNLFLALYLYRIRKQAEYMTLREFFDHM